MELWIATIQSNTHFQHHSITTGSPYKQETEDFFPRSLCQLGSLWKVPGFARSSSNINLVLPPSTAWNSKPGQPVFMKEVHGNVWKTGVIDQPAKEPDSYWIKFPDSSILRRTCQMVKPRSLLSHFKLETQSKEWNNSQFIPSSASRNFQTMLPDTEQPALPTASPVTPAFHEKGTSSVRQDIATNSSSSSGVQPSI